jgi:hypothetical protein
MKKRLPSLKELDQIIKRWPLWIGTILIFVPGILYQIQIENITLLNYSGLLVIILLMTSLAYSIPFIILGGAIYILLMLLENDKKIKWRDSDLLGISFISLISYWAILTFQNLLITNISAFKPFWTLYLSFLSIAFFIIIIISLIKFIIMGIKYLFKKIKKIFKKIKKIFKKIKKVLKEKKSK